MANYAQTKKLRTKKLPVKSYSFKCKRQKPSRVLVVTQKMLTYMFEYYKKNS